MAKARVSLRLDRSGVGQVMTSEALLGICVDVGTELASRAGSGYVVTPEPDRRTSRASSIVADPGDRAMGREAALGNLARAVSSMEEPWQK